MTFSIEDMATFCKSKGFVFPNSEIYGGIAGFFDYGPLGVELKNRIKGSWWRKFVQGRDDVYGIDGTTITHPKVWEASGHIANFNDVYVNEIAGKMYSDMQKVPKSNVSFNFDCCNCCGNGPFPSPNPINLIANVI